MRTPDSDFTPAAFRYAAEQIRVGERRSDPASIFLFNFLRNMSAHPGPFSEDLALAHLGQFLSAGKAYDVLRMLVELDFFHRQHGPMGPDNVLYRVHWPQVYRQRSNFEHARYEETESINRMREALELVRAQLREAVRHSEQVADEYERETTWSARLRKWWASKLDRRHRVITEAQLIGSSIDQTTDSFNEILNLLGPPPESAEQPAVTPTVPVGVA